MFDVQRVSTGEPLLRAGDGSPLYISPRAVTFQNHVYPTRNLCHFGPGTIPKYRIPASLCIAAIGVGSGVFLLGSMIALISSAGSSYRGGGGGGGFFFGFIAFLGFVLLGAGVAGLIVKLVNPQIPGLVITMNSGQHVFFSTVDRQGVDRLTHIVLRMTEDLENVAASAKVGQNEIYIKEITVTGGVANLGDLRGDVTIDARGTQPQAQSRPDR